MKKCNLSYVTYYSSIAALAIFGTSCKPREFNSESKGIAFKGEKSPVEAYYDLGQYIKDPQLRKYMDNEEISFWFYPKWFDTNSNGEKELHVCVYAAAVSRGENTASNNDTKRFLNNSAKLKGGKYINWSTMFQKLDDLAKQRPNSLAKGEVVNNTIAAGFEETAKLIKIERKKLEFNANIIEEMQVMTSPSGTTPEADLLAILLGRPPQDQTAAALTGLLLAIDQVEAEKSDCPKQETVLKRVTKP